MNIIEKLSFEIRHFLIQRSLRKIDQSPVVGSNPKYIIKYKDGRPDEKTDNCAECIGFMFHKKNCSFNKK